MSKTIEEQIKDFIEWFDSDWLEDPDYKELIIGFIGGMLQERDRIARKEERERISIKISSLQRWADTDAGEAGMRAEIDGEWLDEDDVLQALNTPKDE